MLIPSRVLSRWTVPLLLLVLVPALLASCGDDDDDNEGDATPSATAAEQTPTPTATSSATEQPSEATPTEQADEPDPLTISTSSSAELGSFLVGPNGLTLYVFTVDQPDTSACAGDCLANWPPLTAIDGQAVTSDDTLPFELGTLTRDDGTQQVTYNSAPLYYWAADGAPGDTTGHRVGGVWFVARPDTASTAVVNVQTSGDLAPYLVGPDAMTLYVFANDEPGVSNCSGQCLGNWPALTVGQAPLIEDAAVAGELGIAERDDGTLQVSYNGAPLYYWVGDSVPGDTTGDGVGGVWSVATPSGETAGSVDGGSGSELPNYD